MSLSEAPHQLARRFSLRRELGCGGMGIVWHATDELLGREVAVKQIKPTALSRAGVDSKLQDRMMREARAAARLNHPGAVTVYDVVRDGDDIYIVMELVDASSLHDLVKKDGPLPFSRVAAIGREILEVLAAAHRVGIVHRDVKPANVMILPGDRVKLTDFGIARLAGDPTLTAAGAALGSPAYMAPEQIRGAASTAATDLWALGATLYYAVEGKPAFAAGNAAAAIAAVLTDSPPIPQQAGPLGAVLLQLLMKDPAERPTSEQLKQQLRHLVSATTPTDRPAKTGPSAAPADGGRFVAPGAKLSTYALALGPVTGSLIFIGSLSVTIAAHAGALMSLLWWAWLLHVAIAIAIAIQTARRPFYLSMDEFAIEYVRGRSRGRFRWADVGAIEIEQIVDSKRIVVLLRLNDEAEQAVQLTGSPRYPPWLERATGRVGLCDLTRLNVPIQQIEQALARFAGPRWRPQR